MVGFTALSAQIVFLRELLVLFYGNELALGVILGCWLFWTGIGSLLLGKLVNRIRHPAGFLGLLQVLLAVVMIATLLAIRAVKLFLPISPGQILGYGIIWEASFLLLSIFCVLNGFLFPLACKAWERLAPPGGPPARHFSLIYILETLGAVAGGIFTSLILIRYLHSLPLLLGLGFLNLAAGGLILIFLNRKRSWRAGGVIVGLIYLGMVAAGGPAYLKRQSLRWQWRGFQVKKTENSIYGKLVVTGREGQFSLFENGLLLFTHPDLFSAEEAVHFALLQHPHPEKVLLLGGGAGGSLKEILKYPSLKKVTYLELDPTVIRLAREFLPDRERRSLSDPRVEIINQDGRLFLARSRDKYDVIIVSLPDPYTAQLNRFYTQEFFSLVKRHLSRGGVFGFSVTSAENYISPELQNVVGCLDRTLRSVFERVLVVPGGDNYFLASDRHRKLTASVSQLEESISSRGLNLKYIRGYYLTDRLRPERISYLKERLKAASAARINRDFYPICYYYDLVLWSSYFAGERGGKFGSFLQQAVILRWWWFLLPPLVALVVAPILSKRRKKSRGIRTLLPVFTSGFSEIVFQVVVLLAFQILYGYVYYKLGIILTLFMVGLALGSWLISRKLERLENDYRIFALVQIGICLYPLLLPGIFSGLSNCSGPLPAWVGENLVFPLLPLFSGFLGGVQLPLAVRIYLSGGKKLGGAAGKVYGYDLLGACLGAILISTLVIPILGVAATCYAAALINLTSLIVILAFR